MNNKKDIIILYLFLILEFLILSKSKIITKNMVDIINIFLYTILPSTLPSMIIGNMLVKYNFFQIISKPINAIFKKLFNFNNVMTSIFIISIFIGAPSNALFINNYLEQKYISEKQAETLLYTTHFINPLFVVYTIGIKMFNNYKIGLLFIFIMIIENLIKAFILKKKNIYKDITITKEKNNFIDSILSSIKISVNTCIIIFGIVITFNILISLISNIFSLNIFTTLFTNTILEMTTALTKIQHINVNYIIKISLSYFTINFGGLCIHMQTISMLKKIKVKYLKYLTFRII